MLLAIAILGSGWAGYRLLQSVRAGRDRSS